MRWASPATRAQGRSDSTADSGAPGSLAPRWRAVGPAYQGLIAFVIYLVVFILGFGQALAPHLTTPVVGQSEVDPNFYIWAIRWWPYAITHLLNPLYSSQIGAPGGYNLAWATTMPSVALFMWPVTALAGPIAAFNVTLLLAPPASAWGTFIVARRMTGQFWASLMAGPVFGFCVYEMQHEASGQPNLTVTVLLPLIAYLILRWWDGDLGRNAFMAWMTVAMTLEFYTFVEAYAELTILLAAGLLLGFALAGHALRPKVARLALLSAISYVGSVVLAVPYLLFALHNYPQSLTRQQSQFSLDFAGLVLPRSDRLLGMKWWAPSAGHVLSNTVYLGIPLIMVFAGLVIFGWRRRLVRYLAASLLVVLLFAAGPDLIVDGRQFATLPWAFIWSLPVLKSAEALRFIDFGYLVLAIVLALWLAELTKSRLVRAARWGLGILALAAIFADTLTFASVVVPPPAMHYKPAFPAMSRTDAIPAFFTDGTYRKYIKPGEIVVVLSHRGNAGMMFQAYTGFYFRIAGGFINASLSRIDALPYPVALLSHPTKARVAGFKAYAKEAGVGALVVERAWSEHWMYIFGKIGMESNTVGGVTIFRNPSS